jgi:hypothetical protein
LPMTVHNKKYREKESCRKYAYPLLLIHNPYA